MYYKACSALVFAVLAFCAFSVRTAQAQLLLPTPLMGEGDSREQDRSRIENGLGVFLSLDGGMTSYTTTYDGVRLQERLAGLSSTGQKRKAEYVEKSQRLYSLGAIFGVHWAFLDRLTLTGGIGGYYLQLENTDSDFPNDRFVDYDPNPGFSALLGITWEPVRMTYVSFVIGLQLSYLSTYGLTGRTLEAKTTFPQGGSTKVVDINTTDIMIHLINFEPHLGLEWRPLSSFATNGFGIYYSYVVSAASMKQEVRVYNKDVDSSGNSFESGDREVAEIDLWMKPKQAVGVYYGWYFNIPHFGTLGVEAQLCNRWAGSLSYQYSF